MAEYTRLARINGSSKRPVEQRSPRLAGAFRIVNVLEVTPDEVISWGDKQRDCGYPDTFVKQNDERRSCFGLNDGSIGIHMENSEQFETRFVEVFQPIFLWGVGALELILVLYTVYMEFVTGTGPSLLSTVLPLSVVIAIVWAVLAVLITLIVIGIKNRTNRGKP